MIMLLQNGPHRIARSAGYCVWNECYPRGRVHSDGQRPAQPGNRLRVGDVDSLRWCLPDAPLLDTAGREGSFCARHPRRAAEPSLQCGRDAPGLVVSDGTRSGANRNDSTAAAEWCVPVSDRAAKLPRSLHAAALLAPRGSGRPAATAQAPRPVFEPHDGSPTPAGALALRSGLDGFGALRQTRRGAHRLQPQQAGAPFLLPAAVFRSPDPGLLAWRVATRGCGHAARRAGVRPSLLCQSPAQCPARDFARRQRVFRSQADRLGGAARRKLRHRGTAYSAGPTATERSALPPLRLGRRDRWVSLPASRLDTSGAFRSDPTAAAGGSQRTTATVSTRALSLPSSRHQSAPAATQPLALLQPSRCRRADHQAAQRRLRPGAHPHAPLLGQRNLLPFALAGLQPDELVQAALPAARFPDRHTANIAPESLVDARTVAAHSQPTEPRPARERAARNRVATCTRKNRTTQTLRPCVFAQDSGLSVFICVHLWFHSHVCPTANLSISHSDRISATVPRTSSELSPVYPKRECEHFGGLRCTKPSR